MSKVFAGFLAATLLVLAVGCSGSDDDALVECISVLVEVTRDHDHPASQGSPGSSSFGSSSVGVGQPLMPGEWLQDNDVSSQFHSGVQDFINEKCAPLLSASATPKAGPSATPKAGPRELIEYPAK